MCIPLNIKENDTQPVNWLFSLQAPTKISKGVTTLVPMSLQSHLKTNPKPTMS